MKVGVISLSIVDMFGGGCFEDHAVNFIGCSPSMHKIPHSHPSVLTTEMSPDCAQCPIGNKSLQICHFTIL